MSKQVSKRLSYREELAVCRENRDAFMKSAGHWIEEYEKLKVVLVEKDRTIAEFKSLNRLLESDAEEYQSSIFALARALASSLTHNHNAARSKLLDELRAEET